MKPIRNVLLLAGSMFAVAASAQPQQQPPPSIASTVDREIGAIEKQIVEAAEAMPEDKFWRLTEPAQFGLP